MSIHDIKHIVEAVPEAFEHMKKASVEDEYSTRTKDDTLLSCLRIAYQEKVANCHVPEEVHSKVSKAARLYGLDKQASEFCDALVSRSLTKEAGVSDAEIKQAEELIESKLSWSKDIEKLASACTDLYDAHSDAVQSEVVQRYAGAAYFDKEAALSALTARYAASKDGEFMKVARVIRSTDFGKIDVEVNRAIADTVVGLDKKAGLLERGFDFYQDVFLVKSAGISVLNIDVNGKPLPVESILRLGKQNLETILGPELVAEMGTDPEQIKAVLDTVPLDLKKVLLQRCA